MKRPTLTLVILVSLLAGFAARDLVSTAQAQTTPPPTAACTMIGQVGTPSSLASSWMNQQLAAGRTRFVTFSSTMCAW